MGNSKKSIEEFVYESKKIHGDRYCYSKSVYFCNKTKLIVSCVQHGDFLVCPSNHIRLKSGCPSCKKETLRKLKLKNIEWFIKKSHEVHGSIYAYHNAQYIGLHEKIEISCNVHGSLSQTPATHIYGKAGCPKCSGFGMTLQEFLKKSNEVHKGVYDYSGTNFTFKTGKISYICSTHGRIEQVASAHLSGKGCYKCSGGVLDNKEFIRRAQNKHGNRYDYSFVKYVNASTKILINCKQHGLYSQLPSNHIAGQNCPYCAKSVSSMEQQWLTSLGVDRLLWQKSLRCGSKRYIIDALDETKMLAYEFWGDKWHGNPLIYKSVDINPVTKTSYGSLLEKTLIKREAIENAGYKLVEIWECDWIRDRKS